MACRLERESVKIPTHSCVANLSSAIWMAISSALMIVRVSSVLLASMDMVVQVERCANAAPSRGWPLMSEPSVYIHCSGRNMEVHGCGVRAIYGADGSVESPPIGRQGMSIMPGRAWEDV